MAALPPMPQNWEDTRATLHAYAKAVTALPRVHATPHPRWWHIALTVEPGGFITETFSLPDGERATVRMDLGAHEVVLRTSDGRSWAWPMGEGLTATELGDALIDTARALGLEGDYSRERFENDDPRPYDPVAAKAFYAVIEAVAATFAEHRGTLEGNVGPIHMWPGGFDLSFEWFGTRMVQVEEGGKLVEYPAQLNLGFYPAGDPYFYSNPWPFDIEGLTENQLPEGSEWYVEDWEGARLRYAELNDDPMATERLLRYAAAVFEFAAPSLNS
jgi:Family of unknown function (DUF5996)